MNNRLGDLDVFADKASDDPTPPRLHDTAANPSKKQYHDVESRNWSKEEAGGPYSAENSTDQSEEMRQFFSHVEYLQGAISKIATSTNEITRLNEEAMLATTTSREKELSSELEPLVRGTNGDAKRAKDVLGLLRKDNGHFINSGGNAADLRIRENLVNTLTRKFIAEMKLYQTAQKKYRADIKSKVRRQVQIVKPDATEEQIDAVMRDGANGGGGVEGLYRESILMGVADPIRNAYANVADKYNDVLTLEASVTELHQMFLDFALLVEQQGELLDQIEFQVKSAGDYIDDGNVDIVKAIEKQKSVRKKQCW
eukprot:CAMPEP_0113308780 /NCGR_PEP_ID=MMETSP0010_2-20120614/7094_1 /TAXON_ID=216773 ORGANISM="Corethron hystrix, Strain 308" /NCGR_SAMPLE_ID=MMETSP0010_2 /ASSEMBLY_ACC=CAM_ASM_000155 /LENGTH=311 /DNA_ID=CAMNT_0000163915 /DNA_START=165 /DNA_END=1097 /DNA_ORIENTATION=- /assembly_acc=CAM_ASM_000155